MPLSLTVLHHSPTPSPVQLSLVHHSGSTGGASVLHGVVQRPIPSAVPPTTRLVGQLRSCRTNIYA
eukprot:3941722-Rhodomonas_salina.5